MGTRNNRGNHLVQIAEIDSLIIMKTYFRKKAGRKWTKRSPHGESENKIDFILSVNFDIVMDVTVLNKLKSSDNSSKMSLKPKKGEGSVTQTQAGNQRKVRKLHPKNSKQIPKPR